MPNITVIGSLGDERYLTVQPVDSTTVRVKLWQADNSAPTVVDSMTITAITVIAFAENDFGVVALHTLDPGYATAKLTVFSMDGDTLNSVSVNLGNDWTDYGQWSLNRRTLWVSGDGQEAVTLTFPTSTIMLTAFNTDDCSQAWTLDIKSLYTDYTSYIIGFPRAGRFLFMYTVPRSQWNDVQVGDHIIRLYNSSKTLLDSIPFHDPFDEWTYPKEIWIPHTNQSMTYIRSLPEDWVSP